MPAPTVSASLDKAAYQPDETMTLTVSYSDPDTEAVTVTIVVTDSQGNTSDPATVTAVVDPSVLTVTDTSGREWTKASDNGSVAVYTASA